jgi:hypothetical protein
MSEPASQRLPANQAGLILVGLVTVWVIFIFVSRREKPAPPVASVVTESKLKAVGLPDNVDWEGLPGFFDVFADHAVWENGKAQFAYWNPGSHSYSYFFEATQEDGKVRFRPISKAMLSVSLDLLLQELGEKDDSNYEVPTHPIVFPEPMVRAKGGFGLNHAPEFKPESSSADQSQVKIEIRTVPLLPETSTKNQPSPDEPGKK